MTKKQFHLEIGVAHDCHSLYSAHYYLSQLLLFPQIRLPNLNKCLYRYQLAALCA